MQHIRNRGFFIKADICQKGAAWQREGNVVINGIGETHSTAQTVERPLAPVTKRRTIK
jgi:hypothetical protein